MKKLTTTLSGFEQIIWYGLCVLLLIMPFHAFLVTIGGHVLGHELFLQAWKELIIGVVLLLAAIVYFFKRQTLRWASYNILAVFITVLSICVSLIVSRDIVAILAGIKTNLLCLGLFFAGQVIAKRFDWQKKNWLILGPAVIVAILGITQVYLIPVGLLITLGYNQATIIPQQFVETTAHSLRAFSTLGGPNQFGTYLILPFSLALADSIQRRRAISMVLSTMFVIACFFSYSRSAWLGMLAAAMVVIWMQLRKQYKVVVGVLIILFGLLLVLFSAGQICQFSSYIPGYLLHGGCNNGVIGGSDSQRLESLRSGAVTIATYPFGLGLGSAGPASFYAKTPRITENWYIQIAIEVGLVGLLLYLGFFFSVIRELYLRSYKTNQVNVFAVGLLAGFLGVLISCLFLHSLADSTLAIIFFTLLGLELGKKRGKA